MSTSDVITPRLVAKNPPKFLSFTQADGRPITIAPDAIASVEPEENINGEWTLIRLKTGNRVYVVEECKDVVEMLPA